MSNLKIIESIYHPYKITLKGNCQIIESSTGKFVLKKQNKDLFTLYSYLSSRGLEIYPSLIRNFNEEDNLQEYLTSINIPFEQYLNEMAKTLAELHSKTSYEKTISEDEIKEIKENIDNNIYYLKNKYHSIIRKTILTEYLSPKEYYFIRNYHKIEEALDFCLKENNNLYLEIKNNKTIRVSLLHNNLSLDHFIITPNKNAFISWDNYRFDLPLLDIVSFYQKNYNLNFPSFLNTYFNIFPYLESEKKLLFILLSIPDNIDIENDFKILINQIQKVYSTEELIRPYYPENKEE